MTRAVDVLKQSLGVAAGQGSPSVSGDLNDAASCANLLAVGCNGSETARIGALCHANSCGCISVNTADQAMVAVNQSAPGLVVIDIDNCDVYAPLLINQLRGNTNVPSSAPIVAFGRVLTEGLKQQLIEAGATDVLSWYRSEDFSG